MSDESTIVDDVSLEDDKKEKKSQHHVTKVTEDVVECAVKRKLSISQEDSQTEAKMCRHLKHNSPESPQWVGTQEVVEANVLVSCHIDHLENNHGVRLMQQHTKRHV